MSLAIGVDIGGTKVLAAVVDDEGRVLAEARRDTPADDVVGVHGRIIEVIGELVRDHRVDSIGVGAAGWIDAARSTVMFAPNLAWRDEPLRDKIAADVDVPVVVENDANVAAWAEFRYGAARGTESALLFTVGTGIGGGAIIEGRLLRGKHGVAAEFGHMLAVPGGHVCGCGRHGCLEQYASGNALVRFAREMAAENDTAAGTLLALAGGDAKAINGPMVTEAAREGDPVAIAAFNRVGGYLGEGLADMAQAFDPETFVIGGGVIEAGELLLAPARASYEKALAARSRIPVADVRAASLGVHAGVIGAADLSRTR
ncbi:glucokinase [Actinorhabdospora filicis]|uniref:Glucokinase n=1 Tax=Actinorhabdospora filicis TaxID=1785913 RepID=A0A9W6SQK5_9ACTN|nr:ROK family glucokinase [Actinorhabdospora filicis]GLZ80057.1 glucokinase [Actinorhabdospora filicis]